MLSPSILPSDQSTIFGDSSFFTQPDVPITLPSPSEVRAAANVNDPRHGNSNRTEIVLFPSLGLLVKFGRVVTIAEGQCLWAIQQFLPGAVPVPEVYDWCQDGGEMFIYMQLVPGCTSVERWETLSNKERVEVCDQLGSMTTALRSFVQDPKDQFIGNIGRQAIQDIIFVSSCSPPAGPFPTVQSFHDWFTHLPFSYDRASGTWPHPMRSLLPDDAPIAFTQGDLHPSNIVISSENEGPPRTRAIIDWHPSGWVPRSWEYCKARWTADPGGEWQVEYLPRFLEPFAQYHYWDYFVLTLGV